MEAGDVITDVPNGPWLVLTSSAMPELVDELIEEGKSHPFGLAGVVYSRPGLDGVRADLARIERGSLAWFGQHRRDQARRWKRLKRMQRPPGSVMHAQMAGIVEYRPPAP